jgi:hypothetical protein
MKDYIDFIASSIDENVKKCINFNSGASQKCVRCDGMQCGGE